MKLSVIIPVYNTEKYLAECLDSVLLQTLQDLEVICIDDASSDRSAQILVDYADRDERIKLVMLSQNHGQAFARNRGLEIARGEYVYFMDSDDMLALPEALEILYNEAVKCNTDCLLFDAISLFENNDVEKKKKSLKLKISGEYSGIYTGIEAFSTLGKNNDFLPMVWIQFWKTSFLRQNELLFHNKTSPHEDVLFSFQGMILSKRIKHIGKNLYIYRVRESSSTDVEFSLKRLKASVICYIESLKFIQNLKSENFMIDSLVQYLNAFKYYIRSCVIYLTKQGVDVMGVMLDQSVFAQMIFKTLLLEEFITCGHILTHNEYKRIVSSPNVIVYGAGKIGREIANMLEAYGINDFYIAVTKVKNENECIHGRNVIALSSLSYLRNESIVLLAAAERYHESMKHEMNRFGFYKYINMYR